jgi:hypothetical protein
MNLNELERSTLESAEIPQLTQEQIDFNLARQRRSLQSLAKAFPGDRNYGNVNLDAPKSGVIDRFLYDWRNTPIHKKALYLSSPFLIGGGLIALANLPQLNSL